MLGVFATSSSVGFMRSAQFAVPHMTHLTVKWGFKFDDIRVLADGIKGGHYERLPTKDNILEAMEWLVEGARAHDSLVFFCE